MKTVHMTTKFLPPKKGVVAVMTRNCPSVVCLLMLFDKIVLCFGVLLEVFLYLRHLSVVEIQAQTKRIQEKYRQMWVSEKNSPLELVPKL